MKMKLSLALAAIPASILALSFACDGGSVTDCTVDTDCTDAQNSVGEPTPFCDGTICVADVGECAADLDCELRDDDSATSSDEEACAASGDCDVGEHCVEIGGGNGGAVCAAEAVGDDCTAVAGTDSTSVTDTENNSFNACLSAATCEGNGSCTFD